MHLLVHYILLISQNDGLAVQLGNLEQQIEQVTNIPVSGDGSGARCSVTIGGTDGPLIWTVTAISVQQMDLDIHMVQFLLMTLLNNIIFK